MTGLRDIATEVGTLPPRSGHYHRGRDIATEVGTLPPRSGHCHRGRDIVTLNLLVFKNNINTKHIITFFHVLVLKKKHDLAVI